MSKSLSNTSLVRRIMGGLGRRLIRFADAETRPSAALALLASPPTVTAARPVASLPIKPSSLLISSPDLPDRITQTPEDIGDSVILEIRQGTSLVLLHGRAGTGKSTIIKTLRSKGLRHVVVAPTGIAALNAGGQTIHSFFGIPPRIINLSDICPSNKLRSILNRLDVLVIDEVSMVRADLLDVIDQTMKVNLGNTRPFGGVPILLVGDFLQLPPIAEEQDASILKLRDYDVIHAFGAKCLDRLNVKIIELNTVYRQTDPTFTGLLGHLRYGEKLKEVVDAFNQRCHRPHRMGFSPVTLTSRTVSADEYNRKGLMKLPGKEATFVGAIKDKFNIQRDKLPAPEYLRLRNGARVMLVKNDPEKRWVNGSLATVTKLGEDEVWVKLDSRAEEYQVHRATWESIEYRPDPASGKVNAQVVGTYSQIPLVLAWAITIHKAQGLTLTDVRVDMGAGAFSAGQTYVALSRATNLEGLSFATPLRISDVKADTKLVEHVRTFAARSQINHVEPS